MNNTYGSEADHIVCSPVGMVTQGAAEGPPLRIIHSFCLV